MSEQLLLSMYLVKLRSCTYSLPAPPPPPTCAEPLFDRPQLHARTSISSLCFESRDSPFRSPILMNMSSAMRTVSCEKNLTPPPPLRSGEGELSKEVCDAVASLQVLSGN